MISKILCFTIFIVFYGAVTCAYGQELNNHYPQMEADSIILKNHDHNQRASSQTMEAAIRFFSKMDIKGMSTKELKQLLGDPVKVSALNNEIIWEYMFHDGESGVNQKVILNNVGDLVERVVNVPTE